MFANILSTMPFGNIHPDIESNLVHQHLQCEDKNLFNKNNIFDY